MWFVWLIYGSVALILSWYFIGMPPQLGSFIKDVLIFSIVFIIVFNRKLVMKTLNTKKNVDSKIGE